MSTKISRKVSIDTKFYNFLRPVLGFWFKKQFKLTADISEEVINLSAPFLLFPNHQGFWDPFMAGIFIKYPVFYIASDAVFRYPLFEYFMKLLGAIPKKKAQSDLDSIKHIMKIRDAGGVIGVFPEGRRTWDGTTLPLVYSTSKLIKLLKIPVVTALFKGGYYSHPRWGKHIQKGKVRIEYKLLFQKDEIRKLSVEEIHKILTEALSFDEVAYQEKVKHIYTGKNPAEYMEQAVYLCPNCKETGTIRSSGDTVACSSCGYSVTIDEYRNLTSNRNKVIFNTIRDWIKWQNSEFEGYISGIYGRDNEKILIQDNGLTVQRVLPGGKRMKPFLNNAGITLSVEKMTILDKNGKDIISFRVKDLHAVNVQNKEKLDFYYDSILYNIFDKKKRFSAYKWLVAIQQIQRLAGTNAPFV